MKIFYLVDRKYNGKYPEIIINNNKKDFSKIPVINSNSSVEFVLDKMKELNTNILPVFKNKKFLGIVKKNHLIKFKDEYDKELNNKIQKHKNLNLNNKYTILLKNIPCAVYSAIPDEIGTTTYMSHKWKEWTGFSPNDFYVDPETWPKSIHPEDRDEAIRKYNKSIREKKEYIHEYRVIHKITKKVRFLKDHSIPIFNNNTIIQFDGIVYDITEQKLLENEKEILLSKLKERIKELNCLYKISDIIEKNLKNNLNIIFQEIVDILPLSWQYPEITCARIKYDNAYFSSNEICKSIEECEKVSVDSIKNEIICNDKKRGEISINYINKRPVADKGPFLNEEIKLLDTISKRLGRLIEYKEAENELLKHKDHLEKLVEERTLKLLRENREKKISETKLKNSEERYKNITNTITDYIYTVYIDKNKPIKTLHKPTCYNITGYTENEFNKNQYLWIKMVHKDDKEWVKKHVDNIISNKNNSTFEHRIIRKDSKIRWIENTPVFHFDNNGNIISYDGVIHDITKRKWEEEKNKTILQSAVDGFSIVDLEGNIQEVNDNYCKMLEYEKEELLKMNISQFEINRNKKEIESMMKKIIMKGHGRFESETRTKNGKILIIQISINYVPMNKGWFFCFSRDVTNQKNNEKKITQMALFAELNPAPVLRVDENKQIIMANKSANDIFQIDNLTGTNIKKIISNFKDIDVKKIIKQNQFIRFIKKINKKYYNFVVRGVSEFNVIHIYGSDITIRKLSEEALRINNEILEKIFLNTHFCIVLFDTNFNFIKVNNAYADTCGKKPGYFQGKNHFDLFPDKENKKIFKNVVTTGNPFTIHAKPFIFPDMPERGVTYWDWTLLPIKSDNKKTEYLLFCLVEVTEKQINKQKLEKLNTKLEENIMMLDKSFTELKDKQKQLIQSGKMAALGQLASGIAHEISQPLMGISMGIETILFKSLKNNIDINFVKNKCNELLQYITHIKKTIEHIRIFSREQKSELLNNFNINNSIEYALKLISAQFKNNNIKIKLNIKKNIPYIYGNVFKVEQIILNLLSNSKDALNEKEELIKKGKIKIKKFIKKIKISTYNNNSQVFLIILDNGIGINKSNFNKIFDPFFTTKKPVKGTGIGLSVTYSILKEINGNIKVKSINKKYTKFILTFPYKISKQKG